MSLVKSQIPRSDYGRDTLILSSVCVATIGVCVFGAVNFGCRTFLFYQNLGGLIMSTMQEKMSALTKLMNEGILTATEFASIVTVLNGDTSNVTVKKKTPLELQYDEIFSKHIINAFKSPSSCKWPELTSDMIIKGSIKYDGKENQCTYISTYIDAPNSYGAMLRKDLRLVIDDNGKITRALQKAETSGVTLFGMLANAALKNTWMDIVKF